MLFDSSFTHQSRSGNVVLADYPLVGLHDVEGTLSRVLDAVPVDVVFLTVPLVPADSHTRADALRDVIVPDGVTRPAEPEPSRVRVLLFLAYVVLDEVVGGALLDVYALVTVRPERVVVDPVVAADISVDVVGAAGPQLHFGRL